MKNREYTKSSIVQNTRGGTDLLEVLILVGIVLGVVGGVVLFGGVIKDKYFGADGNTQALVAFQNGAEAGATQGTNANDVIEDVSSDDVTVLSGSDADKALNDQNFTGSQQPSNDTNTGGNSAPNSVKSSVGNTTFGGEEITRHRARIPMDRRPQIGRL